MVSLENHALEIRKKFLEIHFQARSGHVGSGLSCVDLLTYIYGTFLRADDRFILSKGHAASALYVTLHHFGRLSSEVLSSYYQDGTVLPAHPAPLGLAEITAATGSLGHGLPISTGLAYAFQVLEKKDHRVVCLMSDGECDEGSVWEACLFASHHRLEKLVVVIDANGLQGFGKTKDVLNLEPLADKWQSFGFRVREINGHSFGEIKAAFESSEKGPLCIIARTVKGKGLSFFEDKLASHYLPLTQEQYQTALAELVGAPAS